MTNIHAHTVVTAAVALSGAALFVVALMAASPVVLLAALMLFAWVPRTGATS